MKLVKKKIPVQILPSGDVLNIWTYTFWGSGTKSVYIQANIHGPEMTGIVVLKKLVDFFKKNDLSYKKIILVPSCNPMGLNSQYVGQQTGYLNILTGKNWNRIYFDLSSGIKLKKNTTVHKFKRLLWKELQQKKSETIFVESQLALILQELSFDCDIVIDLHTSWGSAPHYVYCYEKQLKKAKNFGVDNIILLSENEFFGVFDEAQLYPYFKFQKKIKNFSIPKQVFTLELGSDNQLNPTNIDLSFKEMLGFLKDQKHQLPKAIVTICKAKDFVYFYAPVGGLIVWDIKPGEYFQKGQVLANIFALRSDKKVPVKSKINGKMIIQFNAHAVHQGQQICKVMTKSKKT